jgi:PIN domain nuclease of toxin-antitoxin system
VILLDTHIVLWLGLSPERISSAAAAAIQQSESVGESAALSVMTLYEVANTLRRGRIQTTIPHAIFLDRIRSRFKVFPVSEAIAICAAQLAEPFHGDPIDRIIAATAIVENCALITADRQIHAAGFCKVIW